MSTSLLYHAFGVHTFHYIKTVYREGGVFCHPRKKPGVVRCVACGSDDVVCDGMNEVTVRTVPAGQHPVFRVRHPRSPTPPIESHPDGAAPACQLDRSDKGARRKSGGRLAVLVLGLVLSSWALHGLVRMYTSELFSLPYVLSGKTVAVAAPGIALGLLLAQWPALRTVARMNLADTVRGREG